MNIYVLVKIESTTFFLDVQDILLLETFISKEDFHYVVNRETIGSFKLRRFGRRKKLAPLFPGLQY